MRFSRTGLFLFLLANVSVWAKQGLILPSQSPSTASQPTYVSSTPTKDSQAIAIVNQVLTVAGGATAIAAITDYTGSGSITYQWPEQAQGSVVVRGGNLASFRLDATVPSGKRSMAILNGQVSESNEQGTVDNIYTQASMLPSRFALPYLPFSFLVSGPVYSFSYRGLTVIDGHSAHDVQIQRVMPQPIDPNSWFAKHITIDFFVDASTYQIVMMEDTLNRTHLRRIRYSNYTKANGLLVPTTISEEVDGAPSFSIQLNKITFNSGLQDSDFQL